MIKFREKLKKYVPVGTYIILALTILCGAIHLAAIFSESFADFFSRYVGSIFRAALSYITVWIPFSLAEAILIMIPVTFALLLVYSFKLSADTVKSTRFIITVMSLIPTLYCLFILGFGTGYYTSPIDQKLGLERKDVSADELYYTSMIIGEELNKLTEEINFITESSSVSPYSVRETSDFICEAYEKIYSEYEFISPLWSRVKPIVLSEPMTYTHIGGVYTFFTGESNVNTNFPDYTIPYTIAHELAHQRGIAREDEANFVAYLVCISSDDPYIRYSGYLNMYEYVISALYSADPELYSQTISCLDIEIRYDMYAFSKFFDKYRDSVAADISGAVNDTYLKLQGTEGSRSYGLVVDLTVAYYLTEN